MNKNTRKIITAVLSAAMLTTSVTGLAANTVSFRDVTTTAWYYADIQTASELGIINGRVQQTCNGRVYIWQIAR